MSTGIEVHQDCINAFQDLKLKKKNKYIVFKMDKGLRQVVLETVSDDADYEKFLESLPENETRYIVYDVEYEADGGGRRNKLVFMAWGPDQAPVKFKMVHAGTKEAVKKTLDGIAVEIQATDFDEITYNAVVEKLKRIR